MKTFRFISGCTVVILAILASCSDQGTEPTPRTSTFPLISGSSWHYHRATHLIHTNPPSDSIVNTKDLYRRVLGPGRFGDSLQAMIVIDSTWSGPGYSTLIHWLGISNSKLIEYARASIDDGRYFDPLIYDVPYVVMDFPLNVGREWNGFSLSGYLSHWDVMGTSPIQVGNRAFDCDIVETILSSVIPEDTTDTIVREYYADQGLIYSTIDNGYHVRVDSTGNPIDTTHAITYINLIDYHVNK